MVKTHITPLQNTYNLAIPKKYIGKKVEILIYSIDEVQVEKPIKSTMADFWGILSDETAADLHNLTNTGREEWEKRLTAK